MVLTPLLEYDLIKVLTVEVNTTDANGTKLELVFLLHTAIYLKRKEHEGYKEQKETNEGQKLFDQWIQCDKSNKESLIDGFHHLEKSADLRNLEAIVFISDIYRFGCAHNGEIWIKPDPEKAKHYIQIGAIEMKHPVMMLHLAAVYGKEGDKKKAIDLFEQAYQSGTILAAEVYGELLIKGDILERDIPRGLSILQDLSENKRSPQSSYVLGLYYFDDKQVEKGFKFMTQAADDGSVDALKFLGRAYMDPNFKDYEKAFKILSDPRLSQDATSLFHLGVCYTLGKGTEINTENATNCFLQAAFRGSIPAQLQLAQWYASGKNVTKNLAYATGLYKMAANQGDPTGAYNVASAYLYGYGVEHNFELYEKYLKLALDLGSEDAMFTYANQMWVDPNRKNEDIPKIIEYLTTVVQKKDAKEAHYSLGVILVDDNQYQDIKKGIHHLSIAVDKGIPLAAEYLAFIYSSPSYGVHNMELAIKYYKIAADAGSAKAAFNLAGILMNEGQSINENTIQVDAQSIELFQSKSIDREAVEKYLKIAADQGSPQSQNMLAVLYSYNFFGKEVDPKLILDLYKKSCDQGDSGGILSYATCLYHGTFTAEKNHKESLRLYLIAADRGCPRSQYSVGYMYHSGEGCERDLEKAIKYYTLSADQGLREAQFWVSSLLYKTNDGKNTPLVLKYLRMAVENDHSEALSTLGEFYLRGHLVKQDYETALDYLTRAADMNNPTAIYLLGTMYYDGEGVQQNTTLAIQYFQMIYKQNPVAAYVLALIYGNGVGGIPANLDKAFYYAKSSADAGFENAYSFVGECYMEGLGVEKNETLGNEYIKKYEEFLAAGGSALEENNQ